MNRERSERLSSGEVDLLRRWMINTGLMLEQSDPETALATAEGFRAIANNEVPPGTWYIGLGRAHRGAHYRVLLSPFGE